MVNSEHKLTVDDLIVEYMMYKVKNGYEPSFLTSEFISFLYFFTAPHDIKVIDALYENDKLFKRFFERKNESDWSKKGSYAALENVAEPHMDMSLYNGEYCDYIIKANYKLSEFDRSIINTYFMTDKTVAKIRQRINEYLVEVLEAPKRRIDIFYPVEKDNLLIGKYIAAEFVGNIWDSYIRDHVENNEWPKQCKDINTFLIKTDLAEIIGVESIRDRLLNFYNVISRRVAVLYQRDKNLQISSFSNGYLAYSNYLALKRGYEDMFEIAYGKNKSNLQIDMSKLKFTESHECDGVYDWDDDIDIVSTDVSIGNKSAKRLVKKFDEVLKSGRN